MKADDNQERIRFLSPEAARDLQQHIYGMQTGEGNTLVRINSAWSGNVRWGRNRVVSTGDTENSRVSIGRSRFGMLTWTATNGLNDDALRATVKRAEAIQEFYPKNPEDFEDPPVRFYPYENPDIWHDSSYNLDAENRAKIAAELVGRSVDDGFLGAGYLAVGATARVVGDSIDLSRYYPYTTAELSVTIRDPKRGASGWAGVDWDDWNRIDFNKIYSIAAEKCRRSMNPVAVEPGRYTAILEPQAVCDLWSPLMEKMSREDAESDRGPWRLRRGLSKLSLRVMDERITVGVDPMDPDLGFPPFDWEGHSYQKVNWIENGVLTNLDYRRRYAVVALGHDRPLPNSGAFRISGGNTSIEEMIATTPRGMVVTRFTNIRLLDSESMLMSGYTRDGLWLVENGKIAKAVKNFRFVDSPLFVFNNLLQIGPAQRVYHPSAPAICPPIKSRDFAFTALVDAV